MNSLLESERSYTTSNNLYLLNSQSGLGYIGSTKLHLGTDYPMLRSSAVPLYMQLDDGPSAGGKVTYGSGKVTYGLSMVYLMSHTMPDQYLCMGTKLPLLANYNTAEQIIESFCTVSVRIIENCPSQSSLLL